MQRRVDKAHSGKSRRPKTARTKADKAAPARASIATKPTGEGTGLGHSISHDIIVKETRRLARSRYAARRVHRNQSDLAARRSFAS